MYIDADCTVESVKIDSVFEKFPDADFAAAPDVFPPDHFNAGVLLIKPSAATFEHLTKLIPATPSYDGGDTGFLNSILQPLWY